MDFQALPEGCIATILSYTTPADVCRLSVVSKIFCSAAESDDVWNHFLPSDADIIISRADSESTSLANSPSKKTLYLALSHHPIIIDQGTKSFQLERKSGKKCYMLAARALSIIWGDTPQYWNWSTLPDSRFPEVAQLLHVCWLEIRGMINTLALSPNTQYAAYLVFKMIDGRGFRQSPVELSVGALHGHSTTHTVCLDPNLGSRPHRRVVGLPRPNERSDGWLEIEMGEFFNSGLEDEVQMSVVETKYGNWKSGLLLEGIEVRPKEDN
ncbi:putative F-box protein PP2-B12 [Gastrolobium bilobum]|uniref:putative F-box protein PP2-B12 n=1 Tax=Gastrolobium bilobum TaxID=150636 RepID=UPI002AB14BE4|nr:putative F-box protein PP2-B12 [Gastrolobium bilobum]